jgi:hypothetical protein
MKQEQKKVKEGICFKREDGELVYLTLAQIFRERQEYARKTERMDTAFEE